MHACIPLCLIKHDRGVSKSRAPWQQRRGVADQGPIIVTYQATILGGGRAIHGARVVILLDCGRDESRPYFSGARES